jgi:hypothetical protein
MGAEVIAIGMGDDVDPKELALIVDHPSDLILGTHTYTHKHNTTF